MNSYFSHDSNARNDDKLLNVRMKYGMEGYGIYWGIIERLREEQNYMGKMDYNVLGFDFHVDAAKVKDIVENFGLFSFTDDGECFYSDSLNNRMAHMDDRKAKRSQAGRKGAAKRWGSEVIAKPLTDNSNAIAKPSKSDSNKTKLNKNKINNTKEHQPAAKSKKPAFAAGAPEYQSAELLWNKIKTNNPDAKEPNLQKWADQIRLMHEQDKRSFEKIDKMIDACQRDEFWAGVILSTANLRKNYDKMAAQFNARVKHGTKAVKGPLPAWINHSDSAKQQAPATEPSGSGEVYGGSIQAKLERLNKLRDGVK